MFASFKNRWWIVIASMFGQMVVSGSINTFAVFLKPVSEGLGISRSVMASGLLIAAVVSGVATPFMGFLIDRWGSRETMLAGIPLFALTIAAFASLSASPISIYGLFALAGLLGSAHNVAPYAKVISKWFDRDRGLALSIALTGFGLGIAVVPQLVELMIQAVGWRLAYVGLAALIMLLAFVPVFLFIREPTAVELAAATGRREDAVPGVSAAEAFSGDWRFWAISVGFFLAVVAVHGTLTHLIAMLTDRGLPATQATAAMSAAGLGLVLGRLVSGWFIDRFHGPYVAICFFIIPAIGIGCIGSGVGGVVPMIGAVLCGVGGGAHAGLLAFFVGRYFGLKAYGTIFGAMYGLFLMGSGVGAFLSGLSFDFLYSYEPALIAFGACLLAGATLLVPLGPYPFVERKSAV